MSADDVGQTYTYALNGFEAQLTADEVVALERQLEGLLHGDDVRAAFPGEPRRLGIVDVDLLGLEESGELGPLGHGLRLARRFRREVLSPLDRGR